MRCNKPVSQNVAGNTIKKFHYRAGVIPRRPQSLQINIARLGVYRFYLLTELQRRFGHQLLVAADAVSSMTDDKHRIADDKH